MRSAVTSLQTSVAKMTVQDLHARLTALPKIQVPVKTVSSANEKQDSSKDSTGEPGINQSEQSIVMISTNHRPGTVDGKMQQGETGALHPHGQPNCC